jgi:hypothetical protein
MHDLVEKIKSNLPSGYTMWIFGQVANLMLALVLVFVSIHLLRQSLDLVSELALSVGMMLFALTVMNICLSKHERVVIVRPSDWLSPDTKDREIVIKNVIKEQIKFSSIFGTTVIPAKTVYWYTNLKVIYRLGEAPRVISTSDWF